MPRIQGAGGFAGLADRGDLLGYPTQPLIRHEGASNWYRADISETHALRSIVTGEMTVTAPDGLPIHLRYQRHIEHANGNWTWIGRDARGEDAIITFGEKAVFGSIPREGRDELRLSTLGGHSWIVEIIPGKQHDPRSSKPDYLVPPRVAAALTASSSTEPAVQSAAVTATAAATTVDVALGYTTGFASELGGDSQAVTRLQNLVDITNQAYVNSQIDARIRLVRTMAVNYADATSNNDALNKLTGSTGSSSVPVDPAFYGLRAARDQYGADLVALVRRFRTPQNEGCGVAWLLGAGQTGIDGFDAPYGYGVVSDDLDVGDLDETDGKTYICRKETLAHELGHNMGQTHNVEDGGSGGAHTYSYGYRETITTGFYTVMAYRLPNSSQKAIRYFANPNVVDAVTGRPTGVANASDNARSMALTMPIIATFRATVVIFSDVPPDYWAYDAIKRLSNAGVTAGCGTHDPYAPIYCPHDTVTRDQMAVFLVRAIHGSGYIPVAGTGMFADVPTGYWAMSWIEQLVRDGVTQGCATNPLRYCPTDSVSRAQMAVFLLRAKYGSSYVPPAPTGVFQDVPTSYWAAAWIEKLASDGVTTGCSASPKLYCPDSVVTRDQMAVFLVRNFGF